MRAWERTSALRVTALGITYVPPAKEPPVSKTSKELTDLLARGDLVTALLQRHFPHESPTPVLIAAAAYAKRDRLTRAAFIAGAGAAFDAIRVELHAAKES